MLYVPLPLQTRRRNSRHTKARRSVFHFSLSPWARISSRDQTCFRRNGFLNLRSEEWREQAALVCFCSTRSLKKWLKSSICSPKMSENKAKLQVQGPDASLCCQTAGEGGITPVCVCVCARPCTCTCRPEFMQQVSSAAAPLFCNLSLSEASHTSVNASKVPHTCTHVHTLCPSQR